MEALSSLGQRKSKVSVSYFVLNLDMRPHIGVRRGNAETNIILVEAREGEIEN